ncbi:hypothetical protein LUZ60_002638 [Juncus effusus]|nr:hypothetical protein LUZ60_002638 [Juncus effusus]
MASSSAASSSNSTLQFRSRFGDTSQTKIFVGGLPWETTSQELHAFFAPFGEILEAVVITDRITGRSKGYGFVTFQEPDAARRAVADPNPIIGGRRSNCNIASLGRPRPFMPRGRGQGIGQYYGPQQPMRSTYGRLQAQMQPNSPAMYSSYYGYPTYPADYAYQQAMYNSPVSPHQYYQNLYGPGSPSTGGPQPYNYPQVGRFQSPQLGAHSLPYIPQSTAQIDPAVSGSLHDVFQLQPAPLPRLALNAPVTESQNGETAKEEEPNRESADS